MNTLDKAMSLLSDYPRRLQAFATSQDEAGICSNVRDLRKVVPRSNPANRTLGQAVRTHFATGTKALRVLQDAGEPLVLELRSPRKYERELEALSQASVSDLRADDLRIIGQHVADARKAIGAPTPIAAPAPVMAGSLVTFANQLATAGQFRVPGDTFMRFARWVPEQCTPENPLGEYRYPGGPRQVGLELVVAYAEFASTLERESGISVPGGREVQQLAQQAQAYRAAQIQNEITVQQQRLLSVLDALDLRIQAALQVHQERATEILYGDRSTPSTTIGQEPPTQER